ncbi:unannotated protein [freshwater metagenome]|uniref:Unannotated protein n=1 Tax=freshwater metagenome TaxID=449393 RepID=A0A6J7KIV0_9ZZZZ
MTTALQRPQLVVGHIRNQRCGARVATEEVLAHESPIFGLEGLVVAVRSAVHQVDESAFGVAGQQVVPLATPNDLDDVPAGTSEEGFELLHDFSVTANRPVEALEVAVDHEGQVVKTVIRRELECTA